MSKQIPIVKPGDPDYASSKSYLKSRKSLNRLTKRNEIVGFLDAIDIDDGTSKKDRLPKGGPIIPLISPRAHIPTKSFVDTIKTRDSIDDFLSTLPGVKKSAPRRQKSKESVCTISTETTEALGDSLNLSPIEDNTLQYPYVKEVAVEENEKDQADNSLLKNGEWTSRLTEEDKVRIKREVRETVKAKMAEIEKKKREKEEEKKAKRKEKKARLKAKAEEEARIKAQEAATRAKAEQEAAKKAEAAQAEIEARALAKRLEEAVRVKAEAEKASRILAERVKSEETARIRAQEESRVRTNRIKNKEEAMILAARIKVEQEEDVRAKAKTEEQERIKLEQEKAKELADTKREEDETRLKSMLEEQSIELEYYSESEDEVTVMSDDFYTVSEDEVTVESDDFYMESADEVTVESGDFYTDSEEGKTVETEDSEEFYDAVVVSDGEDTDYFYETDSGDDIDFDCDESDDDTLFYDTDDGDVLYLLEDIVEEEENSKDIERFEEEVLGNESDMEIIVEDDDDYVNMKVIEEYDDGIGCEEEYDFELDVIHEEDSYDGDDDEFYGAADNISYATEIEVGEDDISFNYEKIDDVSSVVDEAFYVNDEGEEIFFEEYDSTKEELGVENGTVQHPKKEKDPMMQKFNDFLKVMTANNDEMDDAFTNLLQIDDDESVDAEEIVFSDNNSSIDIEYIGDDGMIEEVYCSDDEELITIGDVLSIDQLTNDDASCLGSILSDMESSLEAESFLDDNDDSYYNNDFLADYEDDDRYKFLVAKIPVLQKWENDHRKELLKAIHLKAKADGFVKDTSGPDVAPRTPRNVMMAVLHAGFLDFKLRKVPAEHKTEYKSISDAAASLGRLTKLKEHIVQTESVGLTQRQTDEWKPSGQAILLTRSATVHISNDAAAMGQITRLREEYYTNWDEDDYGEESKVDVAERKNIFERNMDKYEREGEIDELRDEKGRIVFRTSHLIHHHIRDARIERGEKDWTMDVLESIAEQEEMRRNIQLPTTKLPKYRKKKAAKSLSRVQYIEAIAQGVAESAWDRKYRLDRPKAQLRMKNQCYCIYCKNPNPFQTHAYKQLAFQHKVNEGQTPEWAESKLVPRLNSLDLSCSAVPQDATSSSLKTLTNRRRSIEFRRQQKNEWEEANVRSRSPSLESFPKSQDISSPTQTYWSKRNLNRNARIDWSGAITSLEQA